MRVYIPFDDGSLVSFDGTNFVVHRRPLDMDQPDGPDDSRAAQAWKEDWQALVRALESAWRRQMEVRRDEQAKRVYSGKRENPR